MSNIEDSFNPAFIINEQPSIYLSLADEISCPFCKSLIHDEINIPEEGVRQILNRSNWDRKLVSVIVA